MIETKIAKEHIKFRNNEIATTGLRERSGVRCDEHKQTCQRWLDELNKLTNMMKDDGKDSQNHPACDIILNSKKDKEQAIKIYEEAGI